MIEVRKAQEQDTNFILSTWLKGALHGNSFFSLIPRDTFFENYERVIKAIIERAETRIATLPDDPNIILGYSVTEPGIIHWVYVKKAWRKMGIAKTLTQGPFDTVTHVTDLSLAILKNKPKIFNPFLI